jgi:hypothetical protein
MRIVVVSYYDPFFVPIVREICARTGWEVSDWFATNDPLVDPRATFPGAQVYRPEVASRGTMPPDARPEEIPQLDQEILSRMAPYEAMFMRMLDIYDPDGRAFSGRERRTAYFDLLRATLHIVRKRKPGLLITGTIPHALHDYMVYAVCKAQGIDTLMYVPFTVPGYLLLYSSMEEGHERLAAVYRRLLQEDAPGQPVELPADLDRYVSGVTKDYSIGEPWYTRLRDHVMVLNRSPWTALRIRVRDLLFDLKFAAAFAAAPRRRYQQHFVQPLPDFFKQRGVRLRDSQTSQFGANRVFIAGMRVKKKLLRQYREFERPPDLTAKFVFVPLHYQPEASTSPLGGAFVDQILMLQLLASHLPGDWRIYVKEHRTTFDPWLRGHFARDLEYYREIMDTPRTAIVPMELSSFDLIDRAQAVATVTGTAGWEAVVRGVPAIIFGNAWYKDCDGVFDGRTGEGCASAVAAIAQGARPGARRVRLFLKAVAEVALRADRDTTEVLTDLTAEQSQRATVEHFLREYPLMTARGR